ncbi:PA2169 family four-helix-bundle protein [Aquihabitans sp. G128]|uniref:PA2169 family four-helix-bundle protein n=1 Tax=Aquihabitans sp. G128 TaxID=2849779 RepID=UPI0020B2CEE0|nr:PA2169 family four-helix-bundle protein [Aquihabitans sp. G128]
MTKELIETLQDGSDGFTSAAEKLDKDGETELASSFRELGAQRSKLITELQAIAASYGDQISDSGSVAAKVHRGWMAVKDAIAGSDPDGVLDAAAQGEDHAVAEFEKALDADISPEFKAQLQPMAQQVRGARDQIKSLQAARS